MTDVRNGDRMDDKEPETGRVWIWILLLMMLISAASSAAGVYVYDRYYAQKVLTIDFKKYLIDRKQLFLSGKISQREYEASVDNIERAIDREIRANRHAVILYKDAILKNGKAIEIDN
jgi:hypothetical protein